MMISTTSAVTLWIAWNSVSAYTAYQQQKSALPNQQQRSSESTTSPAVESSSSDASLVPSVLTGYTATVMNAAIIPFVCAKTYIGGSNIVASLSATVSTPATAILTTMMNTIDPRIKYVQKILVLLWWYGYLQTWYNLTHRSLRATYWVSHQTWTLLSPVRKLVYVLKDKCLEKLYDKIQFWPASYCIEKEAKRQELLWAKCDLQGNSLNDGWTLVDGNDSDDENYCCYPIEPHYQYTTEDYQSCGGAGVPVKITNLNSVNTPLHDCSLLSQWAFITSPIPCVNIDTLRKDTTIVNVGRANTTTTTPGSMRVDNTICTHAANILDANVRISLPQINHTF